MGWCAYHVDEGFDRKAEMDKLYNWNDGKRDYKVLKSSMVGATYYGAVRCDDGEDVSVFGVVALTSINNRDWYNFGYKGMTEHDGPVESKCPVSILKLLTPTDSEWANEWRDRCMKYHEEKKRKRAVS